MHSAAATFYGAYDQVALPPLSRRRLSPYVIIAVVAAVLLLGFITADVSAIEALPASVQISAVDWYEGGELLASTGGFNLHPAQTTTVSLSCSTICYRFNSAAVAPPFALVSFTVSYHPDQYTNVTVQAPTDPYQGPLSISLGVG